MVRLPVWRTSKTAIYKMSLDTLVFFEHPFSLLSHLAWFPVIIPTEGAHSIGHAQDRHVLVNFAKFVFSNFFTLSTFKVIKIYAGMASRHSFRNVWQDLRSNFMKSDEFGSVSDEGSSRSDEVGSASILIISCRSFSWRSARDMYAFLSVSQVSVSAHDGEDSSSSVSASPRSWYLKICQFSDPTLLTVSRSANMLFVCFPLLSGRSSSRSPYVYTSACIHSFPSVFHFLFVLAFCDS